MISMLHTLKHIQSLINTAVENAKMEEKHHLIEKMKHIQSVINTAVEN